MRAYRQYMQCRTVEKCENSESTTNGILDSLPGHIHREVQQVTTVGSDILSDHCVTPYSLAQKTTRHPTIRGNVSNGVRPMRIDVSWKRKRTRVYILMLRQHLSGEKGATRIITPTRDDQLHRLLSLSTMILEHSVRRCLVHAV